MGDHQNGQSPALTELRRRLSDGLARARLNKTQLARNVGLGRTTVQLAFQADGSVPSAETVAALARALKLPMGELIELQRAAAKESGTTTAGGSGPGRPMGQWEPHELEVHPAGPGKAASSADTPTVRALPGYVLREHDQVLADAVREVAAGRSRIVVLVGTSSTGKTRACWEAVQPLAVKGWRLWHPFDPTRAEAALAELHRVEPRTVVWLNEAQHYFGARAVGEQIAAAVHTLLTSPERGPVLVLGTLWPEYAHLYTALPTPGRPDPYSRVRELLAGHTQSVPDAFDADALATATALAESGDRLLADALTRARDGGRITQDLAGAPELLRRYEQANPPAKALLEAAMDARRLGVSLHLPQSFLTDAAPDYLTDADYDQLTDDWAERAYAELAELVHGKQAPLRRTTPRPRRPRAPPPPPAAAPPPPPGGARVRGPPPRPHNPPPPPP
ncbi:helix-turn-helix domain-containing protein, partial [[Kitasatospora] papulosa]|uniref:helix-turn-helix domain-containing protein n=1 Tax=[Kitasatospora] papulosa TaxID=1464011 RepID=UPI0036BCC423